MNTCDQCGKESPGFTFWPECRECSDVVCTDCACAGSLDGDSFTVYCKDCRDADTDPRLSSDDVSESMR